MKKHWIFTVALLTLSPSVLAGNREISDSLYEVPGAKCIRKVLDMGEKAKLKHLSKRSLESWNFWTKKQSRIRLDQGIRLDERARTIEGKIRGFKFWIVPVQTELVDGIQNDGNAPHTYWQLHGYRLVTDNAELDKVIYEAKVAARKKWLGVITGAVLLPIGAGAGLTYYGMELQKLAEKEKSEAIARVIADKSDGRPYTVDKIQLDWAKPTATSNSPATALESDRRVAMRSSLGGIQKDPLAIWTRVSEANQKYASLPESEREREVSRLAESLTYNGYTLAELRAHRENLNADFYSQLLNELTRWVR